MSLADRGLTWYSIDVKVNTGPRGMIHEGLSCISLKSGISSLLGWGTVLRWFYRKVPYMSTAWSWAAASGQYIESMRMH